MRAKLPYGQGLWPAFWFLGNQVPWPPCGEIDLMEFIQLILILKIITLIQGEFIFIHFIEKKI